MELKQLKQFSVLALVCEMQCSTAWLRLLRLENVVLSGVINSSNLPCHEKGGNEVDRRSTPFNTVPAIAAISVSQWYIEQPPFQKELEPLSSFEYSKFPRGNVGEPDYAIAFCKPGLDLTEGLCKMVCVRWFV